ncbi:MAG TPA: LppX_LprAFG lipoprotein [Candidatus Dormibacteraeota bacterium]|nr:LppX_LprAFG lipoprotein [Candidatus Dormibacteraeota bacterium]
MRSRLAASCAGAFVVILIAACGGLQPEDPAQALREAGSAMAQLKTVNATLSLTKGTISFIGFTLVKANASVRLPAESDTVYTVRQKDVQFAVQVIITGGRVFLHIPFTATTELTGANAATIPDLAKLFDAKTGLPAVIPAGTGAKYLGAEQVDGVDSHKVEATYSASQVHSMFPQLTSSGDVDAVIWIGGSDHLIRKAVLSGMFGDNGTASSVEVDLSAFNGAVTIASPVVSPSS